MSSNLIKQKTHCFRGAVTLVMVALLTLSFTGCFLFEQAVVPSTPTTPSAPARSLAVGDKVGEKTIVWENTGRGSWRFLAMGTPSEPMPWDLDSSRHISTKNLSPDMGAGKENSIVLKTEFESNGSKTHTVKNSSVMYCISRGGWLPSRDEAEKMAQFTSKDFWTSLCEPSSKAYYYSPLQKGLQSKWRNDREPIVAIPVYYLDAQGNITEP